MFTGIVEATGKVLGRKEDGGNVRFLISAPFISELKVDQSISHNGACLTVTEIFSDHYSVTAIAETLRKTNLGTLKSGDEINLERCMKIGDRLDGHIVQGHVDSVATVADIKDENGSWIFRFLFDAKNGITVPKGSICVNGVSLTVVDSKPGEFSVAIIPYTFQNTNFHLMKKDTKVNLEFDIVGKYVAALVNKI
ncbi:MAG TPA: riboflavin synthase [Bacteroidia bacterium]|nr:riboflavin synthase [Bacteroidia bacterium]